MQTLMTLVAIGSAMMLAGAVGAALLILRAVRRMREALALRLPALGAGRDVALMRRDLALDVRATSRVLAAARREGRALEDLERGIGQLSGEARSLDIDLQVIAAERDRSVRRDLLAMHTERADLIHGTCARVRAAVLAGGPGTDHGTLNRIVDDLNEHARAVDHRASAYRELSSLRGR